MKNRNVVVSMAVAALFIAPQPSSAQFFKQLGKAAEKFGKAVLKEITTESQSATESQSTTEAQETTQTAAATTQAASGKPATVHATASTKTITVRGGVNYCGPFSGGLAVIKGENTWFVIDKQGNKLFDFPEDFVPAQYDGYEVKTPVVFENDRLVIAQELALTNKNVRIIDSKGNTIKEFPNVWSASPLRDGLAIIQKHKGFGWEPQYIDGNGNTISCDAPTVLPILQHFCTVWHLREGMRLFYDESKKAYGYMDAQCKIVLPARYPNAYSFTSGLAKVQNSDGLWGFIDKTGKYVIEPMFTNEPSNFSAKYTMVNDKSNVMYLFDKSGNPVFSNSKKLFDITREYVIKGDKAYALWNSNGHEFVIDMTPTPVLPLTVPDNQGDLVDFTDDWLLWADCDVCSSHKVLYDWKGNSLLDYWGTSFSEGFASINSMEYGYTNGYVNTKGELVIKFADTQF